MSQAGLSRRSVLLGGLALLGGGACTGLLGSGVAEAAVGPAIIDCGSWGARPPSSPVTILGRRPVKIIVHHTATDNSPLLDRQHAIGLARAIQNFHMDTRGWLDTGQHFTISRGGVVLEGRHRSLDALHGARDQIQGAHCVGQNDVAIGIENEGTYTAVDAPVALVSSLVALCAYTCAQYGIPPTQIYGHRDFRDTECPGDRLYAWMARLRTRVGAALGIGKEHAAPLTWPLLRIADRGRQVLAAQHLLLAAGITGVPTDGEFGRDTADGVRLFQRTHGLEETGMIGGASWPLLAGQPASSSPSPSPNLTADVSEVSRAAAALGAQVTGVAPQRLDAGVWQQLLAGR